MVKYISQPDEFLFMTFDHDKKVFLGKADKSTKGSIDDEIKPLCDMINSLDDYYTTSSCAGRAMLIKMPASGKKNEAEWLFVSHDKTDSKQLISALSSVPEDSVWFRYEPFILHVAARTVEHAVKLLNLVHDLGIKRAGIISISNKIVLEIIGNEHIDAIVSKQGKMLVDDNYINILVDDANKKRDRNLENMNRLCEAIKKL